MRVEIDIQRAEAIQLIHAVDGKQYEKLGKVYMPFRITPITGIGKIMRNIPSLMWNAATSKAVCQQSLIPSHIISTRIQTGKKIIPVSRGQ